MKRLALACMLATAGLGAHAETYVDNAYVIRVDPQYENVSVPAQECHRRWINEPARIVDRDYGGAVVGGVVGGLIGNQVGKGHGREAATALGAVVGAFTGDNLANRDRIDPYEPVAREVTACQTVQQVQAQLVGYRVTYDYRGQQFTTFMHDKPGPSLRVRVSVDPVGR